MTEYTAVTDWATITTGQKVRATRDGEHLEFTVSTKATASGVTLRSSQSIVQICTYDRPEWVLEVEKVMFVQPTTPGWYFDKDGHPWEVDDSVTLREQWAPYTRIRPEVEVAAEVFAELFAEFDAPNLMSHQADVRTVAARWAAKK